MHGDELLALRASAGSGKTFALTLRYLELLFSGAVASEILTLTFTKKAAQEMQERITGALISLLEEDNPYSDALERDGFSKQEQAKKHKDVLARFLSSDTKIMTIDSFFYMIVKKFCWYAGIPHSFEVGEIEWSEVMSDFLLHLDREEHEQFLNLSISESKGSEAFFGFFKGLWHRRSEFSKQYLPDLMVADEKLIMSHALSIKEHVLQDKSASESARRSVSFESVEELLECGKTWLMKESLSEYTYFKKLKMDGLDSHLYALKGLLKDYFNAKESHFLRTLLRFLELYMSSVHRWQISKCTMSFDSIADSAYELMCGRGIVDSEFLYFRLDSQITHILIDEFQDTSLLQYRILEPLINEIKAGISRKESRSFFYVGDPKQSIYRFRGSHALLFESVATNMQVKNLPYNYRSCENIVEFVNKTFAGRFQSYSPQTAKNPGGLVHVGRGDVREQLIASMTELLESGVSPQKIAILVFSNEDVLSVAGILREHFSGLDVVTETSAKLVEQHEVKAIIHALQYCVHKKDVDGISALALAGFPPKLEELAFLCEYGDARSDEVVLLCMERLGLYTQSARGFLEIAIGFPDIGELLRYCENLERSIATEELQGVRVLTIHRSKGLEFEHTIVLDRFSSPSRRRPPLLYDYDGVKLEHIFYRMKYRENVDSEYADALERDAKESKRDMLNLLYVAFTRAKESLFVLQSDKGGEIAILELGDIRHGSIVVSSSFSKLPTFKEESRKFIECDFGRQSDFLKKERAQSLSTTAARRGEALHLALEHALGYGANSARILDIVRNRYGYFFAQSEEIEIVQKCENVLKSDLLIAILNKGAIKCEVPFLEKGRMRRIDLLCDSPECTYIVDYKSSFITRESYFQQVESYKSFVQKALEKPARGFLLYSDEVHLQEV
ncbi:MAG: RecB-like helicase [Wolinella sp.]